jgi:hypothetical protein
VLLTRDISGVISSPGIDGSTGPAQNGALGPVVTKALQDVLGWKINSNDSKGFVNALTRSIELKDVEGHIEYKWIPRGIAVQDDLAGGIAGAQASLYAMAQSMLGQTLPLISGLRPLKPDADEEYITVARELVQKQLTELVSELGYPGGPRVMRVNQYFRMLTGAKITLVPIVPAPPKNIDFDVQPAFATDPDLVEGTLAALRIQMGLRAGDGTHPANHREKGYVNSVDDEQNVTNFRVIVDYVNALLGSWINSIPFFVARKEESKFLGTELVWISRQLNVVSEVVDEIRFLLDSDLVGPSERETLFLGEMNSTDEDGNKIKLPDIALESLLSWIQTFVRNEAPDIIRDGGRFGIGVDFNNMVDELRSYAKGLAADPAPIRELTSDRVRPALKKLVDQLAQLKHRAGKVGRKALPA